MTMPTHGPISLGQARTEIKHTGAVSLGEAAVRKLAGKPSGVISMHDLYGKAFARTHSAHVHRSHGMYEIQNVIPNTFAVTGSSRIKDWHNTKDYSTLYMSGRVSSHIVIHVTIGGVAYTFKHKQYYHGETSFSRKHNSGLYNYLKANNGKTIHFTSPG